jgi:DNA-binding MarR family transcriptional regulator
MNSETDAAAAASEGVPVEKVDGVGQLDELAGRLALAIGRINRRIRPESGGLSHGLLSALASVVRSGPIRPGDLAELEVVSAPTLTRLIADLEGRGLIKREVDTADRRSFFLEATATGLDLVLQARSERASRTADLLASLPAGQLNALRAALDALEAAAVAPEVSEP